MLRKRIFALLLAFLSVLAFTGCDMEAIENGLQSAIESEWQRTAEGEQQTLTDMPPATAHPAEETSAAPDENGVYDKKDDVALYLHVYGHLPSNYITKKEAQALGWEGGSLARYAPGKCIGGDTFGNYEGLLPKKKKRVYRECDIGTLGKKDRGAARIIYSDDGLIYYTGDHYKSFTLLYGDEDT